MVNIKGENISESQCKLFVIPYSQYSKAPSYIKKEYLGSKIPLDNFKLGTVDFRVLHNDYQNIHVAIVLDAIGEKKYIDQNDDDYFALRNFMQQLKSYVMKYNISSMCMFAFGLFDVNSRLAEFANIVTDQFGDLKLLHIEIYSSAIKTKGEYIEEKKAIASAYNNKDIEKKYQIFVSSTYSDLIDERKEATQALLECGCIPAGMELFPAASKKQWDIIKSVIDDCDAYILILAGRYGSMGNDDRGNKVGYTEMEFNYALEKNKPIIGFLHNDIGAIEARKVETSEDGRKRLADFYEKVKDGRLIKYWTNKDNLKAVIFQSVTNLKRDTPMSGWVRDTTSAKQVNTKPTGETNGNSISSGVNENEVNSKIINEYKHRLYIAEGEIQKQKGDLEAQQKQFVDTRTLLSRDISKKDDKIKQLEKVLNDTQYELAQKGYESDSVKKSLGLMLLELKEWAKNNGVIF